MIVQFQSLSVRDRKTGQLIRWCHRYATREEADRRIDRLRRMYPDCEVSFVESEP